ncbi:MAG: translesion DNA synthesis-associated protein ImuA [Xanthomonadales bacterium]|nr:translesion DNA synthesis-associated protein ImuA [Xanthomonadales bacterium]
MGAVFNLEALLDARTVWRGQPQHVPASALHPTGHALLDASLPLGGWPQAALTELLVPLDGMGELALLFPTLARLTQAGDRVTLVAPPYRVHAPGWHHAGIDLNQLQVIKAAPRDALWATEQCLRSGACAAVLCWPHQADDRALRRLQVAAETGQCLGFAFRDSRQARNPSPAALRVQVDTDYQLRVLKCRGGLAPARPIPFAGTWQ